MTALSFHLLEWGVISSYICHLHSRGDYSYYSRIVLHRMGEKRQQKKWEAKQDGDGTRTIGGKLILPKKYVTAELPNQPKVLKSKTKLRVRTATGLFSFSAVADRLYRYAGYKLIKTFVSNSRSAIRMGRHLLNKKNRYRRSN